ncbi:MAG: hypothetical protein LBQ21_06765 [Clostridiales Family XIII bacterium]|nr:hypothetical protein [Clostridiales Family XIII bacterium]
MQPKQLQKIKNRSKYEIAAYIFWGFLAVVGVISFLVPKPTVSEIENRPLEEPPAFTAIRLASGRWASEFSVYYSDTFPLRERMIETAALLRDLRGLKGDDGVVIRPDAGVDEGKDGNIKPKAPEKEEEAPAGEETIPAPIAANRLPDMEGERKGAVLMVGDTVLELYGFNEEANATYADTISNFAERHKDTIPTSVMVVPTNVEFKIPERYRDMTASQYDAIAFLYGRISDDVNKVWVYNVMAAHSDEDIYFRTDHHWTGLGAYYAYREFAKSRHMLASSLDDYEQVRHEGFLGSLYKSMGGDSFLKEHPDYLIAYKPPTAYTMTGYEGSDMSGPISMHFAQKPQEIAVTNKYLAYAGGDLPYVNIVTDNKNGKRLVVFKESFANAMLPFLVGNYEEIHVIDFRYYTGDIEAFLQEHAINEALFLNYVSAAGSKTQVEKLRGVIQPR